MDDRIPGKGGVAISKVPDRPVVVGTTAGIPDKSDCIRSYKGVREVSVAVSVDIDRLGFGVAASGTGNR